MNKDVAILQNIADTLEKEPQASQRVLAQNAGMSIGLMNAVLKRFAERGWIMLTNVNLRKLSYAITPAGISELTARSHAFARRTFALANDYNQVLCQLVNDAAKSGKKEVVLYGQSYIKFLLVYACQTIGINIIERNVTDSVDPNALCIIGELNEESDVIRLEKAGCVNLLNLLKK